MQSRLLSILQQHHAEFSQVVPFDPAKQRLLLMDFTTSNTGLTDAVLSDTKQFTSWVNQQLVDAGAIYGIGGYAEHRTIYSVSEVFNAPAGTDEPRRLHLGTDIWGRPHTHVVAPLEGIVHSFAFNNQFGDYGATIILSHQLDGLNFYTLYGHLSLSSIRNLQEGERVAKGDVFAEFGIPSENGSWPPHLHFQLVEDMGEWKGDYPGVCKFSERKQWLHNSPDPDLILQLNRYL